MKASRPGKPESVVIVAARYPCHAHPTWHVFVRETAHALARQGVRVTVVSPLAIQRAFAGGDPFFTTEDAGGASVDVFRPRFVSMSSRRIMRWNTLHLTVWAIRRSVRKILQRHMSRSPNAILGHFLYPAGAAAVGLGRELAIPAFVSTGELSERAPNVAAEGRAIRILNTLVPVGLRRSRLAFSGAAGFLANSEVLARLIEDNLRVTSKQIGVFPNGIDRRRFFPRDQLEMRRKYGLPNDRFLVAFVGNFSPRKGEQRVAEAIAPLDDVAGIFVGSGTFEARGEKALFAGHALHEHVPELLSACDIFALPTTDEGSCNAILEAMACGLPVVSSAGDFNDDILTPEVSIRVDPLDIAAIRVAIRQLRDDQALRERMASAAVSWSKRFDVDTRAAAMLDFMRERLQEARICG